MIRRKKKVSVQELYDLGIATKDGVVNYRKYAAYKLNYQMQGYEVRLRKSKVYR